MDRGGVDPAGWVEEGEDELVVEVGVDYGGDG